MIYWNVLHRWLMKFWKCLRCRLVRTNHDVWTKDRLKESGYPGEPHYSSYFMIRIRKPSDTDSNLQEKIFNVKDIPIIYWGNYKMPFLLVKLKDLRSLSSDSVS